MEALEKYFREYLMDYAEYSNMESYDVYEQLTRNHVEEIIEKGYMDEEDIEFVKSILPDIENYRIRTELEEYIKELEAEQ